MAQTYQDVQKYASKGSHEAEYELVKMVVNNAGVKILKGHVGALWCKHLQRDVFPFTHLSSCFLLSSLMQSSKQQVMKATDMMKMMAELTMDASTATRNP